MYGRLDTRKSTVLSAAKNDHHCNSAPIQPAAVVGNDNIANPNTNAEPPVSQRAACATTDRTMQMCIGCRWNAHTTTQTVDIAS
jgi:hypothetical protein